MRPYILLPIVLGLLFGDFRVGWAEGPAPYRDLSESGAGFLGPGREEAPPEGLTSVRLGLIGPAATPAGRRLREGVTLAVSEANARGGYNGLPYEVVYRATDGPWGMGAKQVAALAYEDSGWVVLGAVEGGGAHLAELVAAKAWVPVVTPAASDFTIDYANVPWVFRCFPGDNLQARALIRYARDQGYRSLTVYSEGDREGRTGLRRLEDAARRARFPLAQHREYLPHQPEGVLRSGERLQTDAVLIWGRAESGLALLKALRRTGFNGPVLGPASFSSEARVGDLGELVAAAPYDLSREDPRMQQFRLRFRKSAGRPADPVALFAYDATCLVISAVEQAGLNRTRIRDVLAEGSFEGVVGTFRFNALGGGQMEPVVMVLRSGGWVRVGQGKEEAERKK